MSKETKEFFKAVLVVLLAFMPQTRVVAQTNPYQANAQAEEQLRQQQAAEAARRAALAAQQASQNAAALNSQANNNSAGNTANQIGSQLLASGMSKLPSCCGATPPTCCPMAIMEIIMGLMGLAQGGANKGAAANHGVNASQNAASSNPYALTNNKDGADTASAFAAIEAAKKNGVKYDPKTGKFTLPNGKVMGPGDIGSKDAAMAAGVSAGDFDKAMSKIADMEKKAGKDSSNLASGDAGVEGGGGGGSMMPPSPDAVDEAIARAAREPTSVAGMAKNFNGDMIGVSGDNIFAMMARRYKQMDSKDSFLPPDAN